MIYFTKIFFRELIRTAGVRAIGMGRGVGLVALRMEGTAVPCPYEHR